MYRGEILPLIMKKKITSSNKMKNICNFRIIDKSEPILIFATFSCFGTSVYNYVIGESGLAIANMIFGFSCALGELRVRKLGIAKHLMDSVDDLKIENLKLKENSDLILVENEKFKNENENFENLLNLLEGNVEDIEDTKQKLFELTNNLKKENFRFESNNLLNLFFLIDLDKSSTLEKQELEKLQGYINLVYKENYDFSALDSDKNGQISLAEFFEKFRKR